MLRLWHELHEMKPERERRGSKNSFLPSSTLAGWVTLAAGIGCSGSLMGLAAEAAPPTSSMAARLTAPSAPLKKWIEVLFFIGTLRSLQSCLAANQ